MTWLYHFRSGSKVFPISSFWKYVRGTQYVGHIVGIRQASYFNQWKNEWIFSSGNFLLWVTGVYWSTLLTSTHLPWWGARPKLLMERRRQRIQHPYNLGIGMWWCPRYFEQPKDCQFLPSINANICHHWCYFINITASWFLWWDLILLKVMREDLPQASKYSRKET